ncbi:MAG TPA: hypothetical protein VFF65_01560 [Phycisphaerales bacterium]|nr:hypothetical protein [Phycisphaerales bacterium]
MRRAFSTTVVSALALAGIAVGLAVADPPEPEVVATVDDGAAGPPFDCGVYKRGTNEWYTVNTCYRPQTCCGWYNHATGASQGTCCLPPQTCVHDLLSTPPTAKCQ